MQSKAFTLIETLLVMLIFSLLIISFGEQAKATIDYSLLKIEARDLKEFLERRILINFHRTNVEILRFNSAGIADSENQNLVLLKQAQLETSLNALLLHPNNICSPGTISLNKHDYRCLITISLRCRISLEC